MVRPCVQTLPLSIAPMIDWTYNHFRVLMRLLAPNALLYTEMQTTGAVLHNPQRALSFQPQEHPIALQLGGSDPSALAKCAVLAEDAGFDEINLNLGCPSDKVQAGRFGACLMKEPLQVAACIEAMKQSVSIPISAKIRIGIDHQDSYEFFSDFVQQLVDSGCQKLIVHARKAWLHGLNPKQNRTIPPVHYDYVYNIKIKFPQLPVHINGNIISQAEVQTHLKRVDGVMLGRLACDNPFSIAKIHKALYPAANELTRSQLVATFLPYLFEEANKGASPSLLVKPLFNLAFGLPGSRQWKQHLMTILQSKKLTYLNELVQYMADIETQQETLVCLNA
ncbi:MAG: tRNA dihydrouridine(20/20a) synthase DusA [Legionella sp.]|nr:tRNA dihydrouridine(20/20a) synthase DusA [Legionella sp.]